MSMPHSCPAPLPINLPRRDLKVHIGSDALSPRFEFTSYVGFALSGSGA
jgi:hypothetical protein